MAAQKMIGIGRESVLMDRRPLIQKHSSIKVFS